MTSTNTNTTNTEIPFAQQTEFRKRHMYKGWHLEPVEHQERDYAITRSPYGYRVLCTPLMGMIDVDVDSQFDVESQIKEALATIEQYAKETKQHWIAYRTAGGMRMLRIDAPQPLDESYLRAVDAVFSSDKLYAKLCIEQKAYRIRLSAKPNRIDAEYPHWSPYDFYDNADGFGAVTKLKLPEFISAYEEKAKHFRIAKRIAEFGSGAVHYRLDDVLEIHDALTGANNDTLPLEPSVSESDCDVKDLQIVAFNEVYRPYGMAPDLIWNVLPLDLRRRLQDANRDAIIAEWDHIQPVVEKWNGEKYISAAKMLKRYKAESLTAGSIPLSHHAPDFDSDTCECNFCTSLRKFDAERTAKQNSEQTAAKHTGDDDFYTQLAQLADL